MPTSAKPEIELSARCACGAASVTVKGRVLSMLICACSDCQRATGTGHATVAMLAGRDVVLAGPIKSFARPADSGAIFTRCFCPECGTPLAGQSSRAPDTILLPAGLFGAEADWFVPTQVIFARSHRDWDTLPEALPRHAAYRTASPT